MTQEQKHKLLQCVLRDLEREQLRRNQIAAERGWLVHPNDMELEGSEREAMLAAWQEGKPYKP